MSGRRRVARAAARLAGGAVLCALLGGARFATADKAPPPPKTPASQQVGPAPAEDEVTIDADSISYDKRDDTISASGDVVIRRGEMTLRADSVEFNRATSEAQASGNTVLVGPDAEIHADEMSLDLDDETGELHEAQIYSDKMGYSLSGKRIEKRPGQSYRIENGRFTTCNCADGKPSWSIASDSLDVELDGYAQLEGGSFEVLGYPILWFPRAALPVYRERQSGLLIPRVGFSNRRGLQILQPFYWAINKNQDATVSLDVETSLRIGFVGEYRYAFNREISGGFQAGYFNEAIRGQTEAVRVPPGANPNVPENRWGVLGDHQQLFDSTKAFAHVLLVGDDLFLREMNVFTSNEKEDTALRTLPFTTTSAGVVQPWERAVLQFQGIYYQDLVGPAVELPSPEPTPIPTPGQTPQPQFVQRESLVIQRAPEALFSAQKVLGFGVMGDFNGSVTNFQRGRGLTGFRGDFRPEGILSLPLGPSFYGTMHAAFRETAYGLTENTMSGGFTGTDPTAPPIDLPSGSSREIVELRGDLGTELQRVYDFPYLGLEKLKHTIEPQLEYLYVPPENQSDLPIFDGIDRINKRSLFTYGFASRLLGRSAGTHEGDAGEVFELTRFSVAQSVDVLRDIPPTSNINPVTGQPSNQSPGDHFSDIDFSLRVNPSAATSVRAYATYDTSENNLSSATIGIRLKEPSRALDLPVRPRLLTRATFNVEYRFITDGILQLLDSSVALPLTDRIAALYAMRYDINAGTFLENYVGMRLLSSCDCWALNVGFTQTRNPNEVQLQAQFSLAGLGTTLGGPSNY